MNEVLFETDFVKIFIPRLQNASPSKIQEVIKPRYNELRNQDIMLSRRDFISGYPDFNVNIYYIFNDDLKSLDELQLRYHWHIKGKNENRVSCLNDFFILYKDYDNDFFYKTNKQLIKENIENNHIYFFDINDNKLNSNLCNMKTYYSFIEDKTEFIKSIEEFFIIYPAVNLETIALFNKNIFKNCVKEKMSNSEIKELIYFYFREVDNTNIILSKEGFLIKYKNFDLTLFKKFNPKYENAKELICMTDYHYNNNLIGSLHNFLLFYKDFNLDTFKDNLLDKSISIIDNLVKYHLDSQHKKELEKTLTEDYEETEETKLINEKKTKICNILWKEFISKKPQNVDLEQYLDNKVSN